MPPEYGCGFVSQMTKDVIDEVELALLNGTPIKLSRWTRIKSWWYCTPVYDWWSYLLCWWEVRKEDMED